MKSNITRVSTALAELKSIIETDKYNASVVGGVLEAITIGETAVESGNSYAQMMTILAEEYDKLVGQLDAKSTAKRKALIAIEWGLSGDLSTLDDMIEHAKEGQDE